MILKYHDFSLSDLGEIAIKQRRDVEGGEAPQRIKVTLEIRLSLFERSYADNYNLLRQAQDAVSTPNQVLLWQNEDTGEDYVNQTATLTSDNFPEEWGTYFQDLNLTFYYYEAIDTSEQNLALTFVKTGSSHKVQLANMMEFSESAATTRFDSKRPHRKETRVKLVGSGMIYADTKLPLADRRTALQGMADLIRAEMGDSAEGRLTYGTIIDRVVRIDEVSAKVDQAICAIPFSFTADYTLFPAEDNYATVEANSDEKDGMTGETLLNINGKIQASDEAAARTKLAAVLTTLRTQYGYTPTAIVVPGGPDVPLPAGSSVQQLELATAANFISANADGDTFTELTFSGQWRKWKPTNQNANFVKTGNKVPVPFGNVRTWDDGYKADRFDVHRSQRRHATGMISAAGTYAADPSLPVAARRTQLLAMQRRMKTEVNGADGTLTYGDWTQVVRVEDFTAHVNQAETGVEWTMTASYSLFPNEGGYATCEFTADVRDDSESGDQYLAFAGEIFAPNGALARAKLNSLRAATLKIYGFTAGQRLRGGAQAHVIDANGDKTSGVPEGIETAGDLKTASFIRLSFNEEYRRRTPGTIINTTFQISTRDDTTSGLVATTYSGTVTASGSNADAAMGAAIARALQLGANKEAQIGGGAASAMAFLKSSQLVIDNRQTTQDNPQEFLRVSFAYEYQSKLATGRAYMEMTTQKVMDSFGTDSETVSGFIVAVDFQTMDALYQAQVRAGYSGRLIRGESSSLNRVKAERSGSFQEQQMRMDFSLTVFSPKAAGTTSGRYGISVRRDFRNLTKVTTVRGSIVALDKDAAEAFITGLEAAMSNGSLMESDRDEDHEFVATVDAFCKLDFSDTFQGPLTGVEGVIEMQVTETITYSATRWAVQPLPYNPNGGGGISIPQPAGQTEGQRIVRGSVTAATKATAQAWAYKHRAMLTGDNIGKYPLPEQMEIGYQLTPRVDGIVFGDGANVEMYRVNFTFGEILPNYLPPSS